MPASYHRLRCEDGTHGIKGPHLAGLPCPETNDLNYFRFRFSAYAFHTFPGANGMLAMAFRVSTMQRAQSASSWQLTDEWLVAISTRSKLSIVARLHSTDFLPANCECSRVGLITGT